MVKPLFLTRALKAKVKLAQTQESFNIILPSVFPYGQCLLTHVAGVRREPLNRVLKNAQEPPVEVCS